MKTFELVSGHDNGQVKHLYENGVLNIEVARGYQGKLVINVKNYANEKLNINILDDSDLEIIEVFDDAYDNNYSLQMSVGNYAKVHHNIVVIEGSGNLEITNDVIVNNNGKYEGILNEIGDTKSNIKTNVYLNEEGSDAYYRVACATSGEDEKNITINIENNAMYTNAKMDNYGIAKDASKLTFTGIGTISHGSKESANHQTSKIVIFDEKCKAETNPYLYIDENDIQASHAAAVGKIDEEQMFYMCSRGLSESEAKKFITLGYLTPVLDYISEYDIKERISNRLGKKVK